jgi:transglutaminase-like putative cysteine protease
MAFRSALLSRSSPAPLAARPSLTLFFLLAGAFLLTLVPHAMQMPFWVSGTVVAAMVLRSVMEVYRMPLPSTGFCGVLALCFLAGVVLQYNTMFGREAGTAFIAGLLAIKFFELRGPRDISMIIFSCFFVVMSALLYSQALELFIYCLIMMWILTALLLRNQVGDRPEDGLLRMLHGSGIVFLQALPLTIFLFFFFPRFPGTLLVHLNEGSLGLSDTIKPGSIARLARDDSPAMYVKFIGEGEPVPSVDTMYWRVLVFWDYHDGTWTQGSEAEAAEEAPHRERYTSQITQEITIYPHFQKWLFALDCPISTAINVEAPSNSGWSTMFSGNVVRLSNMRSEIDHRERYTVISALQLADEDLKPSDPEWKAGIQLPGSNPRDDARDRIDPEVQALADRLYQANPNDEAYIQTLLHYFRHEGFHYSATPGATSKDKDWLHDFLFTTKTGFCEHYASAFAVLMRLEKIPARVVAGYLGGEYNPYKNIYTVQQSNAHAWDEVWVGTKKHWVREDPTAILPPGGTGADTSNGGAPSDGDDDLSIQVAHHRVTLSETYLPGWARKAVTEMRLRREQVEADWDDWVFSYDPDTQNRLAQFLGFGRNAWFMLGLACAAATGLCVIFFRNWMKQKPVISPVEKLYRAFCRNMAQCGVPRAAWEGPLAYTERLAEAFPEKKEAIDGVGRIVSRARYGPFPPDSTAPEKLQTLLTLIAASQAASSSREST